MDSIINYLESKSIDYKKVGNFIQYEGFFYWHAIECKEYTEEESKEAIKLIRNNQSG